MNPPTLNDLCHRAEALAQDLRTLRENEKPPEKWAVERAAFARGETIQWQWACDLEEVPWRDLDPDQPIYWDEHYRFRIKPSPEWTPKFKVGDRVKLRFDRARPNCRIVKASTAPGDAAIVEWGDDGTWWNKSSVFESEMEPYVWTLSRHIPGFRPLEDGEQWHRDDFTEDMLPPGWRPLLFCEIYKAGDERKRLASTDQWENVTLNVGIECGPIHSHARTRRPLPDTERERFERAWLIAGLNLQWSKQAKETAWAIWQAARKAQ